MFNKVFAKVIQADDPTSYTATVNAACSGLQLVLVEYIRLGLTGFLSALANGVEPVTATTSTSPSQFGAIFAMGFMPDGDLTFPVHSDDNYISISQNVTADNGSFDSNWRWYRGSYATKATHTATMSVDNGASKPVYALIITMTGTDTDQFEQNLVAAITGDAQADLTGFVDYTVITNNNSNVDATTYVTGSVAPVLNGYALVTVTNRKTASTPDIPVSIVGTNGWNVTWNLVKSKTVGNFRTSVYQAAVDSTSAGTITVNYGAGNTQLSNVIIVGVFTAVDTEYLTDLSTGMSITQSSENNSGTGTTATMTFASPVGLNSVPFVVVSATATTAAQFSSATLTEEVEVTNTEGASAAQFWESDQAIDAYDVTLAASYDWIAIGLELSLDEITDGGYILFTIPSDQIADDEWELFDQAPDSVDQSLMVKMAEGASAFVYSGTGMPYPRIYDKATATWDNVTDITGARALAYHKNRYFYGGTLANPGRLYYSDFSAGGSIPGTNFIDVQADDGTAIEDVISVENLLLICKTNSLWILSGSGVSSFFLAELEGGGASPGRAACRTPFGTIVADEFNVWSVQGGSVEPVSRPIQGDYQIFGLVSTAYKNDKLYISDSSDGTLWVYNLVSGAWWKEALSDFDEGPHSVRDVVGDQLFFGTQNSEISGPLAYQIQGVPDRIADFAPHETTYHVKSQILFLNGPNFKYTPRHLFLQVRRHGGISPVNITIRAGGNTIEERTWEISSGIEVSRERVDIGWVQGKSWLQIEAEETVVSSGDPFEIEKAILGVDVEPRR